MMRPDNTVLGRATVAYEEAVFVSSYPMDDYRTHKVGVASVMQHLAAEIVVELNIRKMSGHDVAQWFIDEIRGFD